MKREKALTAVQGAALAFLLAFGAVGSMVTGLNLNVQSMGWLALVCAGAGLLAAAAGQIRRGGWLPVGLAVLTGIYLLRSDAAAEQTLDMLSRITRYYDFAYGWGRIRSALQGAGPMDIPVLLTGLWIALAAAWSLSRGGGTRSVLVLTALPLAACVVVTDTVPEEKYLYLWLLGLILALLSRGVRRQNPLWGCRAVWLAAVPAALALGLLFWAVPREGYDKHPDELQERAIQFFQELPDLWDRVTDEVAERFDGTVQPHSVNLRETGPRPKRVYPVMEITAPVTGTVYLRGAHYDTYTGSGWTAAEDARERFESPEVTRELGSITISTRSARDVIYLPYYPDEAINLFGGQVDNPQNEKIYTFTQRGLASHWRNILQSAAVSMGMPWLPAGRTGPSREVNLALPADTYEWAAQQVDAIVYDEATATAVAETIAEYVRNSAVYDLNTPKMSREYTDFARWFLEESDTGYCVHFATAAVVLLRAAGVEARYVEGYMASTVAGEEVTVTADKAHAWAEYYEPLLEAWIVLEATPADLGGGAPEQTRATEASQAPPELPKETTRPPQEETPGTPDTPDAPEGTLPEPGEAPRKPLDLRWLLWILIPAAVALAAEGQRRLRLRHRAAGRNRGSLNRRALNCWRELERLCRLLKTPAPEEARSLAQKAKYSRDGISGGELEVLEDCLARIREEMNGRPWYFKLLDRYIFAVC